MKNRLLTILVLLQGISLFAGETPYFKGYAGFLGQFINDQDSSHVDPELYGQGYFAGQIDFSDKFIFRSEFFMNTGDLLSGKLLESTDDDNSSFRVQELSAVYKLNRPSNTHYLSTFFGEYEPIGSDVFLQRQFGIRPITSRLTDSWHGANGSSIYSLYGAGLSYVLHFDQSLAAGFYIYEDFDDDLHQNAFNTDFRVGGIFQNVTFDFDGGLSFPKDSTKGTFKEAVLVIRYLKFRAGLNLLVGAPSSPFSTFMQAGFTGLNIYTRDNIEDKKMIDLDDITDSIYFLLEPRINLRQAQVAFTFFNIPQETIADSHMIYIQDPLGINLSVSTNKLHLGSNQFTLGMHLTGSIEDKTFKRAWDDRSHSSDWNKNFRITPYTTIPLLGGEVTGSMTMNCTDFFDSDKEKINAFTVRIGFRSQF